MKLWWRHMFIGKLMVWGTEAVQVMGTHGGLVSKDTGVAWEDLLVVSILHRPQAAIEQVCETSKIHKARKEMNLEWKKLTK